MSCKHLIWDVIENSLRVLVVVDMQNDFLIGSLESDEAVKIVPNIVNKIEWYKSKGYPIFLTRDTHDEDYLSTQEGRKLSVEHTIIQTWGWEIYDKIKEAIEGSDYNIIDKDTFGSLYLPLQIHYKISEYVDNLDLSNEDAEKAYNSVIIEIVGTRTGICAISNALILKAYFKENKIVADASCLSCVTPESHKNALEAMKMCQIEVINE